MPSIFHARAAQELGIYASADAVLFWALCLETMEYGGRCSISGTPAELASQIGYEGDSALAVCTLHDLGSRAATVLVLHDESDTLDPSLAAGIDQKTVLLVSGTRQAAMRRKVSSRKRVAAQRHGGRESGACFPASSAWVASAASRPRQLSLGFRDGEQYDAQRAKRVKMAAVVETRAAYGAGTVEQSRSAGHISGAASVGQVACHQNSSPYEANSRPAKNPVARGSAVARNALHGQAADRPDARDYRSAPVGSTGSADRASATRAPHVTFNNQVLNVNVEDRTPRRRADDREDLGAWTLAERLELLRIVDVARTQFGDRINPKDFGDRRLFLGLAAMVHREIFAESQYVQVVQGAARSDRPAAYIMAAYKRIAEKQYGVQFSGMLNGFKYPDLLIPEHAA